MATSVLGMVRGTPRHPRFYLCPSLCSRGHAWSRRPESPGICRFVRRNAGRYIRSDTKGGSRIICATTAAPESDGRLYEVYSSLGSEASVAPTSITRQIKYAIRWSRHPRLKVLHRPSMADPLRSDSRTIPHLRRLYVGSVLYAVVLLYTVVLLHAGLKQTRLCS